MRGWLLVGIAACGTADHAWVQADPTPDPTCTGLYGRPSESTGLTGDQCAPQIAGDAPWTPTPFTDDALDALRAWTLSNPPPVPEVDPYEATPDLTPDGAAVCAILFDDDATYRVETVADPAAATAAGGYVTHGGACGACSSLEDLAVYAGIADLTGPVRQCGLQGLSGDVDGVVACLSELGFSPPCAKIWAYNVQHTRQQCFDTCIALLTAPYHNPDGSLNDCIQCDEDLSGDVFKAVAGRTRRNSGLATALCRPCDTVWRVDHGYALPTAD